MMKLSVISIPKFILKYYDPYYINLAIAFSEQLSNIEFESKDVKTYVGTIDSNEAKEFIDFYLNKTKLDQKLNCRYEDDLNISKSLTNETFIVSIITNNGTTKDNLYIDSYIDNQLILKAE